MAETSPITAKITAVNQNGYQVAGYDDWFNLSKSYQGVPIPPVGTEIEFKYNPWLNPKSNKVVYYVDEIIPVTQVGPSYAGLQQAAAPPAAPTPTPVAEAPRTGPEPLSEDTGPVVGTQAYRDLSIEKQGVLIRAVEALGIVYAGGAAERLSDTQIENLAANITRLGDRIYARYYRRIADVAMPDDSLVPTPSEAGDPGPEEPR